LLTGKYVIVLSILVNWQLANDRSVVSKILNMRAVMQADLASCVDADE
jgi:hypothetical protein